MMVHLRQDVARQEGCLPHRVDIEMDELLDLLLEGIVGLEDTGDCRDQPTGGFAEDGFAQPVLGAEVVVQQGLIDAGFFGDLLHPGARGTPTHEDGPRSVENAVLGRAVTVGGTCLALTSHLNHPV